MKQQLCRTPQNTVNNNNLVRRENCVWKEGKATSGVHQAITTATLTFPPEDQNSSEYLKS